MLGSQNVSRMCLVCGGANPFGLHGRFLLVGADGDHAASAGADGGLPRGDGAASPSFEVLGLFQVREEHQGYPGRLHGGVSAAILDETIGRAILAKEPGTWGVTVEFTARYRAPVPLDAEVRALGRIVRDSRRFFEGTGEILLPDGTVAVEGRGRYVKLAIADIAPGFEEQGEWLADERPLPGSVRL